VPQEFVAILARPLAVGDDDLLAIPAQDLVSGAPRGAAIKKGQAQIQWRFGVGDRDPAQAGQRQEPSRPMFDKKAFVESLDQVGDDHDARRFVKEDHLVQRKGAAKPGRREDGLQEVERRRGPAACELSKTGPISSRADRPSATAIGTGNGADWG